MTLPITHRIQKGFCTQPAWEMWVIIAVLAVAAFVIYPRVQAQRTADIWVAEISSLQPSLTGTSRRAMLARMTKLNALYSPGGIQWLVVETPQHTRLSLVGLDERNCLYVARATPRKTPGSVFTINGKPVHAATDMTFACGEQDRPVVEFELRATPKERK